VRPLDFALRGRSQSVARSTPNGAEIGFQPYAALLAVYGSFLVSGSTEITGRMCRALPHSCGS